MHMIDMRSDTTLALGVSATLSGTTPAAGNIVDLTDYQAATFLFQTGVVTAAGAAGVSVAIQESDTTAASDFTAVADANLLGLESGLTFDDNGDDHKAIGSIGYIGTKRYVRAVVTGTTDTAAVVSGMWVLQKPRYAPKGDVATAIAAT